jgi:DNA-binding Lrp family transcriptional regulator
MTVKEIAIVVNKTERSVRNWIKKLAEKSSVVAEKSSVSSSANPASYDFEETCLIIEIGLGKNAASLFRMNANNLHTPAKNEYVTKDDLKDFAKAIVSETIKQIMPIVNRPKQIEEKIEYFTLRGWEIRKDLRLRSDFENSVLGRLAKKISEEMGKPRPIIDDAKYGRLRTYHVSVLEKLFEDSEEEGI